MFSGSQDITGPQAGVHRWFPYQHISATALADSPSSSLLFSCTSVCMEQYLRISPM